MRVRVHGVEAVAGRGCGGAEFGGLMLVGARGDTAVGGGSVAGNAGVRESDAAVAAEAAETRVPNRHSCQWWGGASDGTAFPNRKLSESPSGDASKCGNGEFGQEYGDG
jgi:hypothetical protein